jgi:hypothetical protein
MREAIDEVSRIEVLQSATTGSPLGSIGEVDAALEWAKGSALWTTLDDDGSVANASPRTINRAVTTELPVEQVPSLSAEKDFSSTTASSSPARSGVPGTTLTVPGGDSGCASDTKKVKELHNRSREALAALDPSNPKDAAATPCGAHNKAGCSGVVRPISPLEDGRPIRDPENSVRLSPTTCGAFKQECTQQHDSGMQKVQAAGPSHSKSIGHQCRQSLSMNRTAQG